MSPKTSRRLVVDASIAFAAGVSTDLTATAIREVLARILSVNHRVVLTPRIYAEWSKRASIHSLAWLAKMQRLGNVDTLDPEQDFDLHEKIRVSTPNAGSVTAMLKDIHLIEAALVTDRIVISLDEKARAHFSSASRAIDELRQILWANPVLKKEKVAYWLERGAKTQKSRQLGYRTR